MAFSDFVKQQALQNANHKCECKRTTHGHSGRCNSTTRLEAHHITALSSGGSDNLSNVEVLCHDCHTKTQTYGG